MSNIVYAINKGVNKPVEFKGLKAQYVVYLGIGLAGLLFSFVILYVLGVPTMVCFGVVLITGGVLFRNVYRLSKRHGQYGLMKRRAARRTPKSIESKSRRVFQL
jgi:hypothetical protein